MPDKTDEEIIKEVVLETTDEITQDEELISQNNDKLSKEEIAETISTDLNDNKISEKKSSSQNETILKEDESLSQNKTIPEEDESLILIQKQRPKIYKVLMSIVAFLLLLITIGAVLYFMGYFDSEPKKKIETKTSNIKKVISFNSKDLNQKRLNKKLTMLTKYEIMNRDELDAEERKIKLVKKKAEAKRKKEITQKKKEAEEKIAANYAKIEKEKEELLKQQLELKKEHKKFIKIQEEATLALEIEKNNFFKELESKKNILQENIMIEDTITENKKVKFFLSFINVATIKGNLYKLFLEKVQKFDKKLSLCRNSKNSIEILFGPYDSNKERIKVFNNLLENDIKEAYLIDFTQVEYEKRCNY